MPLTGHEHPIVFGHYHTEHGKDFIARLLRGYSLKDGVDEVTELLKEHYRGKAKNTLVAATKDLYQQYQMLSTNQTE